MSNDDLKAAALAAYQEQKVKADADSAREREKRSNAAFAQLKAIFPTIERIDEDHFRLCGLEWGIMPIGHTLDGSVRYALERGSGAYQVYDLASLGSFLHFREEIDRRCDALVHKQRGFWRRLFS